MITKDTPSADEPPQSRTVPIADSLRAALGLLRQAYTCTADAGADLWDFALEIGRLFDTGLTISDLRWLVAKGFAEHGQELSVYGAPHRSFRRGKGFFFVKMTCVVLTPSGAAFVDQALKQPVGWRQSIQPFKTAPHASGESTASENGPPASQGPNGTNHVAVKPCWSSTRRELRVNGTVVKRFRVPAQNQEVILSAFEEEGWPDHIDNPLPVSGDIDPPTRLHDAINRLNRCQTNPLLRFYGNGNGIFWEFRPAAGLRQTDGPGTTNE
jgi:hypothetical protein